MGEKRMRIPTLETQTTCLEVSSTETGAICLATWVTWVTWVTWADCLATTKTNMEITNMETWITTTTRTTGKITMTTGIETTRIFTIITGKNKTTKTCTTGIGSKIIINMAAMGKEATKI